MSRHVVERELVLGGDGGGGGRVLAVAHILHALDVLEHRLSAILIGHQLFSALQPEQRVFHHRVAS